MQFIKAPALIVALASAIAFSVHADSSRLNINKASAEKIDKTLVFVGKKKAQAIVEYRKTHGEFNSLDDLVKVKGVGKRLVNRNKTIIAFE
ncbi:ComE operon protein 1 [invertebrate metagenome]|uniref:ComE operon protein 1 n=1 Tax=invertebrate metagenome TaxID=1711999 RepID=A0A2H9TBR3_9ZZZZ